MILSEKTNPTSCQPARIWAIALLTLFVLGFQGPQSARCTTASRDSFELFRKQHDEAHARFAQALNALADACDQKLLIQPAAEIRRLAVPMTAEALQTCHLPKQVQPEIPLDLPPDEREWRTQLQHQRQEYAKELYILSRRVLHGGYPSFAYDLVREVAFHDPDHRLARKILGFERFGNQWVTPAAANLLRKRYQWDDDFGWMPRSHIARYKQGERYFEGRWVSVAKEASLRRDFRHAWQIRTDHYLVKTNHSLERGVELAKALEDFYELLHQSLAGFFYSPEQLKKLFEGSLTGATRRESLQPYEVHFYFSAEEYQQRLIRRYPQVGITNGMYEPDDRIVYFYDNPEENTLATLFHEATHQLFAESQLRKRLIGDDAHFWAVEGIACYMESYTRSSGQASLGNPRYIRFELARARCLDENYYVPLAQFASMGRDAFQRHPEIARNYSQASGLTHFFLHWNGGAYRDAFIEHLSQIYNGNSRTRGRVQSLEELTGTRYADLDQQYIAYSQSLRHAVDKGRF